MVDGLVLRSIGGWVLGLLVDVVNLSVVCLVVDLGVVVLVVVGRGIVRTRMDGRFLVFGL